MAVKNAIAKNFSLPLYLDDRRYSREDVTAPPAPANVTAVAFSDTEIDVDCDASVDPQSSVINYRVYGGQTDGGPYTQLVEPVLFAAFPVRIHSLVPGDWYFKVTALNAAGIETALADCTQTTVVNLDPEDPPEPEDWQLAAGHFIPAKMPMQVIHPRTDAEMSAYARAARCPSSIAWEIPIVAQGGAWPFKYELITGPALMTMVAETVPSDFHTNGAQGYGILYWPSPTVGSHSITVRITDQEGTVVDRSWTLECIDREDETYFQFIAASGGDNGNDGSYSSPKQTILGWYVNKTTNTHAGKQVFYRTGTYAVPITAGTTRELDLTSNHPAVHVGFPGETATFDCGSAYVDVESMSGGDLCFAHLSFVNASTGSSPTRRKQFVRTITLPRRLCYDNYYDGGGNTPSDNGGNSSCIMDSGGAQSYSADVHCTYHQCDNMDFVLYYTRNDAVFEFNNITGGYGGTFNPSWGAFIKGGSCQRFSMRANRGLGAGLLRPLVHCSEFTQELKGSVEVCWNNWLSSSVTDGRFNGYFAFGQGAGAPDAYGPFWSYRNNGNVRYMLQTDIDSGSYEFENDVIQHNGTYTDGLGQEGCAVAITKTNLLTATTGLLDSSNLLTGAARASYLGTHGCEIA